MKTHEKKVRKIFVLIPSLNGDGPAKGAIAIANILSTLNEVYLISLKGNLERQKDILEINKSVSLEIAGRGYYEGIKRFIFLTKQKRPDIVISLCLIPDILNLVLSNNAKSILSFRTNHISGYKDIYGFLGIFIAYFHNFLPVFSYKTLVMSSDHLRILPKLAKKKCTILKNFLNPSISFPKKTLNKKEKFNIVLVSGLTRRKRIKEALDFCEKNKFYIESIHIFGDGYEKNNLISFSNKIDVKTTFYGNVKNPWEICPSNPIFLHLSKDEGFPRAMLEAMAMKIPIISSKFSGVLEYFNLEKDPILLLDDSNFKNSYRDFFLDIKNYQESDFTYDFIKSTNQNFLINDFEKVFN
tara:strand:- start:967 stop:2031 length:1065 start_codon:yes stop_codon:yes gene_type:complete